MSTLDELHRAIGGRLLGDPAVDPSAGLWPIQSDSRRIAPGEVFWAFRGPNHYGEHFAGEAFRRGAIGAVVAEKIHVPKGRWAILVEDSQEAIRRWAHWRRERFAGVVAAITGSAGKTTTRQMIHCVLQTRLRGSASPNNFNNHLGVPLSMAAIQPDHDYAVLELGAGAPGEIAALAQLAAPHIGVITCTGDAHLEGFGDRRGVARAKAELLSALKSDGLAILGDDPWLREVVQDCAAPIAWIGTRENCDLRAMDVRTERGRLMFRIEGQRFCVPVWGRHHLTAALAALAVGRSMGLPLCEMSDALGAFQPVPMRCQVEEIGGATVINDAYNANPTAMRAALELLGELDAAGRRIVVCGDMAELGDRSAVFHWRLGREIVELGRADRLVACGRFAHHVLGGARDAGLPPSKAFLFANVDQCLPQVGEIVAPGDVVLVKGSRVMQMDRAVEALKHQANEKIPPSASGLRELGAYPPSLGRSNGPSAARLLGRPCRRALRGGIF